MLGEDWGGGGELEGEEIWKKRAGWIVRKDVWGGGGFG